MSRDLAASSCHGQAPWPARVLRVRFAAVPMCGRTALSTNPEDLREIFGLDETPQPRPPLQRPAVAAGCGRARHARRARGERWSSCAGASFPSWADDPKMGHRLSLARIETVATHAGLPRRHPPAPLPRRRRRVLRVEARGQEEQPAVLRPPARTALPSRSPASGTAGSSKDGEVVESCAILTQPSRAPVDGGARPDARRARASGVGAWLDPAADGDVSALLEPRSPELVGRTR